MTKFICLDCFYLFWRKTAPKHFACWKCGSANIASRGTFSAKGKSGRYGLAKEAADVALDAAISNQNDTSGVLDGFCEVGCAETDSHNPRAIKIEMPNNSAKGEVDGRLSI